MTDRRLGVPRLSPDRRLRRAVPRADRERGPVRSPPRRVTRFDRRGPTRSWRPGTSSTEIRIPDDCVATSVQGECSVEVPAHDRRPASPDRDRREPPHRGRSGVRRSRSERSIWADPGPRSALRTTTVARPCRLAGTIDGRTVRGRVRRLSKRHPHLATDRVPGLWPAPRRSRLAGGVLRASVRRPGGLGRPSSAAHRHRAHRLRPPERRVVTVAGRRGRGRTGEQRRLSPQRRSL